MPSEQFERTLRERFAQAEMPPPAGLWDRIEAEVAPPPEQKRRFLWIWWSMAALLFCSIGLAWVYQTPASDIPTSQLVEGLPDAPVSQTPDALQTLPSDSAVPATEADPSALTVESPSIESTAEAGTSLASATNAPASASTAETPTTAGTAAASTSQSPAANAALSPALTSTSHPARQGSATTMTTTQSSDDAVSTDVASIETSATEIAGTTQASTASISVEQPIPLPDAGELTSEESSLDMDSHLKLFAIERISPYLSTVPAITGSDALVPVTMPRGGSKWAVDLRFQTGYASGLFATVPIEKSFETDYAGYANRSDYTTGAENSQVATVRFPRWHHSLAVETSRLIHPRWRVSLGLEAQAGIGGRATLGQITRLPDVGLSVPDPADPVIIVDASSIELETPSDFTHVSLALPLRLSYLMPLGSGSLEHAIGFSLNRNWTLVGQQSQLESIAFSFNDLNNEALSQVSLPPPVLDINDWHSDLKLRSRYFLPTRGALQPFVGAEIETQLSPAFGGDAAVNQRSFLVGLELGIRIR